MRKKFKDLTFTDDFMFCAVLQNDEELCRQLAELITGRKIQKIIHPEAQKSVIIRSDRKGVRFDVYFEDDSNLIYDIEMQNTIEGKDLPRRMRYYGGIIDVKQLKSGAKYRDLKNSYIIFICKFNPYEQGLHKYTFENICTEETDIVLNDGTKKIILCSNGSADDVSDEMKKFLEFVGGSTPASDITKRIDEQVRKIKADEEWEREYMTLQEIIDDEREESRAEGRAEGREEGLVEGLEKGNRKAAKNMYDDGFPIDKIAKYVDRSVEVVTSWLEPETEK